MKYIPQDKAIATVESIYKVVDEEPKIDLYRDILKQCFEDFPFDYDIVKVVRCKDCKHNLHGWCESWGDKFYHYEDYEDIDPNGFCEKGERKDE